MIKENKENRPYFLTLNEDGTRTHICLFQKLDDRPQRELVERALYEKLLAELALLKAKESWFSKTWRLIYGVLF